MGGAESLPGPAQCTATGSLDYQQGVAMLKAGQPATLRHMSEQWKQVGSDLTGLGEQLDQKLTRLEQGWEGEASQTYVQRVRSLANTAKEAGERATETYHGLAEAAEQLNDIQGRIPPPTSPYSAGKATVLTPEQDEKARQDAEKDARAVQALINELDEDYYRASSQIPEKFPPYKGPPPAPVTAQQRERITAETADDPGGGGVSSDSSGSAGFSGSGSAGSGGSGGSVGGRGTIAAMSADGPGVGSGGRVGGSPPADAVPPGLVEPGPGDLPGDGDTDLAGVDGALGGVGSAGGTLPGGSGGGAGGSGMVGRGGVLGGAAAGGVVGGAAAGSRGKGASGRVGAAGGVIGGPGSTGGAAGSLGSAAGTGGTGGGGAAGTSQAAGTGGRAAAGGRMMPPMGGMGGGAGEGDSRKRKGWLIETDEVWDDGDDFVAPAVLGDTAQHSSDHEEEYKAPRDSGDGDDGESGYV